MIQRTIKQLQCYGFTDEARGIGDVLGKGAIGIDTDLAKGNSAAFGETNRWSAYFNLAPELFSTDFLTSFVPLIAHEYAHIVDLAHDRFLKN